MPGCARLALNFHAERSANGLANERPKLWGALRQEIHTLRPLASLLPAFWAQIRKKGRRYEQREGKRLWHCDVRTFCNGQTVLGTFSVTNDHCWTNYLERIVLLCAFRTSVCFEFSSLFFFFRFAVFHSTIFCDSRLDREPTREKLVCQLVMEEKNLAIQPPWRSNRRVYRKFHFATCKVSFRGSVRFVRLFAWLVRFCYTVAMVPDI